MESKIEKIIFLDIDGVLTNVDIDGSSFMLLDPSKYRLSEVNMQWLDKILDSTGAKIVIASNWRKFSPPHDAWEHRGKLYKSPLEEFKRLYKGHIIGMLPPERHTSKCECLELWFEDNFWFSKSKGKYVILEDDYCEGYHKHLVYAKHLIMTDSHLGLTEKDAVKAISLLS